MSCTVDLIGKVLQGTFKINRIVGEGGMGAVYEASHLRLVRRFAVKVLHPNPDGYGGLLERFRQEAQVTSALGHPHIVEVIDFNETPQGIPYILMEFLEGEDLAERIKRQGQLAVPAAAAIFRQAVSALQAAHAKGVIHRDLKPQNIFLCRRGKRDDFVKVVDFGISKILGSPSALTGTQTMMGTPYYMAPEQVTEGAATADARTDIYALGAIAYEMLAGCPPFTADSLPTLLYKLVHENPPALSSRRPDIPATVEAVVHKALRKDRGQRHATVDAFWRALRKALRVEKISFIEPTEDRRDDWTEEPSQSWVEDTEPAPGTEETLPPQPLSPQSVSDEVHGGHSAVWSGRATTLASGAGQVSAMRPPSSRRSPWTLALAAVALLGAGAAAAYVALRASGPSGAPDEAKATRPTETPAPVTTAAASSPSPRPADAALAVPPAQAASAPTRTADAAAARKIWIVSRPARARVFLDDKLLGVTPLSKLPLASGDQVLLLKKRGYQDLQVLVEAEEHPAVVRNVTLKRRRRGARVPKEPVAPTAGATKAHEPSTKQARKGWIIRGKIE